MAERIQVVVRFRPLNETEKAKGPERCVNVEEGAVEVVGERARKHTFDRVFASEQEQDEVYAYVGEPTIANVIKGYNGTVLAYGQTGSGKTHTMLGPQGGSADALNAGEPLYQQRGIIPRLAEDLFAQLEALDPKEVRWTVSVSVFELYMERVMDSLGESRNGDFRIREDATGGRGVYVENLYAKACGAAPELLEAIRVGASRRRVASTKSNDTSSRSHSITLITVEQVDEVRGGAAIRSRLTLVDLAGSEKVAKTQASGDRLKEAQMINLSLTLLGNVIFKLTDGKSAYIPYRDSKLTRLLQDSLGGNSRTTLLCCCSLATFNKEETISTLQFAARAKQIKNKPRVNRELGVSELKSALAQALEEIEALKAKMDHQEKMTLARPSSPRLTTAADVATAEAEAEHDALVAELQFKISQLMDEVADLNKQVFTKTEELDHTRQQIDFHKNRADAAEEALGQALAKMKREEKLFQQKLAAVTAAAGNSPRHGPGSTQSFTAISPLAVRSTASAEMDVPSVARADDRGGVGRLLPRRPDGAAQTRLLATESLALGASPKPTAAGTLAADDGVPPPMMATTLAPADDGDAASPSPTKPPLCGLSPCAGPSMSERPGFVDCAVGTEFAVEDAAAVDALRVDLTNAITTIEFLEQKVAEADSQNVDFQLRIETLETDLEGARRAQSSASQREKEMSRAADQLQLAVEESHRAADDSRAELDALRRLLETRDKENAEMKHVLDALNINVHDQLDALKAERERAAGLSDEAKRLAGITEGLKTAWAQQEYAEMVQMELMVKAEDMQAVENEVVAITYGGVTVAEATRQSCLETVEQLDRFLAGVVEKLQAQPFANANLESQRLTLLSEAAGLVGRCLIAKQQLNTDADAEGGDA